jgi:three-Cys-motif partner protein
MPMPRIWFVFVEKEKARADSLRKVLAKKFPRLPKNFKCEVFQGEFEGVIRGIIADMEAKGQVLAPTFTFVDPFGYAGFPLELIDGLLRPSASEVLITFMASRLRRFLDEFHEPAIDELFGSTDWREARKLSGDRRVQFLLKLYTRRLAEATAAKYVMTFEMVGRDSNPIYWLVFATKHPRGCEVMKEAMWKVDSSGLYRFFDAAEGVRTFALDEEDPAWAREAQDLLWHTFRGKEIPIEVLKEFIAPTRFLWRKRKILVPLELAGRIVQVKGRKRPLTHPEGCAIRFAL